MPYETHERKGIKTCLVDASIDPDTLRLHISEAAPGGRLHAPHTHDSIEAFYILEGQAGVEFEGKQVTIGPNEVVHSRRHATAWPGQRRRHHHALHCHHCQEVGDTHD